MLVIVTLFLTVSLLHVNSHIEYCIATVGDDKCGLGVDRFYRLINVYMSLLFFL